MTCHDTRFNVDEHVLVNVLWLPGDRTVADPKRMTVYGTLAKDLLWIRFLNGASG